MIKTLCALGYLLTFTDQPLTSGGQFATFIFRDGDLRFNCDSTECFLSGFADYVKDQTGLRLLSIDKCEKPNNDAELFHLYEIYCMENYPPQHIIWLPPLESEQDELHFD